MDFLDKMKTRDIPAIKKFCKFVNNHDGQLRITLDGSVYEKDKLVYKYEKTIGNELHNI